MSVHARLLVDDYEGCFRFYHDVLGLEATFGDETSGYADFASDDGSFALFVRPEMEQAVGETPELTGELLERDRVVIVIGVSDLQSTVTRLEAKGVNLAVPIKDHPEWGIRTAHLRDPDGNLVELNVPLQSAPAEEHGVQGDAG